MRVGDHLILGVACDQPDGVWAETTPDVHTGTRIWRESCCEIFFGPHPKTPEEAEKPVYMHYIVNSLGALRGFSAAEDNREGVRCGASLAEPGGPESLPKTSLGCLSKTGSQRYFVSPGTGNG
jgi:hypothetical protein